MKKIRDAICSKCDWSGDAQGLPTCPMCRNDLVFLDSSDQEGGQKQEKYPGKLLTKTDDPLDEWTSDF